MSPRDSSAAPATRSSDPGSKPPADAGERPSDATPPRAAGLASPRVILLLVALTLGLSAVAGVQYARYAAVHLRERPRIPLCAIRSRGLLAKPDIVSGTEPRQTAAGQTVYLGPRADRAIACAYQIDESMSRHLTGALAEPDPVRRAGDLVAMLRERIPPDPEHDRAAYAGYILASAALHALPQELPEVRAASDEVDRLQVCRFVTKAKCPTRPPIPLLVWITGVPAAAGLLALCWLGGAPAARGLARWSSKRKTPAKAALPKNADSGSARKDGPDKSKKKKKKKAGDEAQPQGAD